jgi:hypothetical protein
MKSANVLLLSLMLFLIIFGLSAVDRAVACHVPGQAEVSEDQPSAQVEEKATESQRELFEKPIDAEGNYWEGQGLLQNFKVHSFLLILLFTLVAIGLYRRYVKKHLPANPSFTFIISFALFFATVILFNLILYFLAVYYQWLGFDRLNEYIHSVKWWLQIKKTWSLGLGSFYTAHIIDVFLCSLVSYFGLAFSFNWIMGVKE